MSIGSFSSSSGFAAAGVGLSFGGSFGDFRAIRALKQDWIFDAAFPTWGVGSFDFIFGANVNIYTFISYLQMAAL